LRDAASSAPIAGYVALGGDETGKAAADSLLGLCQTKIFHAQSDPVTNEWAANLLGRRRQTLFSSSLQHGNSQPSALGWFDEPSVTTGCHETLEYAIQPHQFALLRKGGTANGCECDAVVFQGGRVWYDSSDSFLVTSFAQGF
jgi:hypothetical protein